jgi:hypothetical protein
MIRNSRPAKDPKILSPSERICHFDIRDLVRVDFVFPYGRVAATQSGLTPEPFDRDAKYSTNPKEIEEMRTRIANLFVKRTR